VSDYETTQKMRNIIVGIFVIIAMCALVWLIYKFGDLPTSVSKIGSFQVFVQFPTAQGVQEDTPVRFCGYQIGRVTDVMAPAKLKDRKTGLVYHQTKVVLRIDKQYVNIPSNVEVKLMTRGLGSSYIELKIDPTLPLEREDPNRPESVYLYNKILLQGSTGMTSEFFPAESQERLDELVDGLRSLIINANEIIGDANNKTNLKATLANMSEASGEAAATLKEIREFFVSSTNTSEELSKAIVKLRQILEKLNEGKGTASQLVNDGRLYEGLLENTAQMQVLLEELREFMAKSRDKGFPIKLK
jgi:phospholipid/cholesterol/gamma-HCH transport system substrate-binding protein